MSFVDQGRSVRPASIAAVVLVHVVIGYAVISGLAYTLIRNGPTVIHTTLIPDDTPPPPPPQMQPPPPASHTTLAQPTKVDPIVPTIDHGPVTVGTYPAEDIQPVVGPPPTVNRPPVTPDLSRGAGVAGDRAGWVTTTDYPASALRAGAEGTTAIRVTVSADGRASDCRVTVSSGNAALDEAACRTYLRRARFRPALDRDGHAIASEHLDRIRWQLPTE